MEKRKILIIDDEVDLVNLVKMRLELHNYHIIPLYTSKRSMEITKREKPDLILLNIMMPDKDGYKVCSELKAYEDTKDIPIILFTATPKQKKYLKTGAESIGADDYISKPFDIADLLKKIENQLKK